VRDDGAVGWHLTEDVELYADRVWSLLAASPAEHTVALTVIESLRAGQRWSDARMLFGSYADGGGVRGAVFLTPPFELLLAAVPEEANEELVAALRRERVPVPGGGNGEPATVDRFAAAWTAGTALRSGAGGVVLFTDLANPTSNAVYRQIGFRPLADRRVVRFGNR
jgi:hypothetical protein